MINIDNRLLEMFNFFFQSPAGFKFSVARKNFKSPGATGRVYSHALLIYSSFSRAKVSVMVQERDHEKAYWGKSFGMRE